MKVQISDLVVRTREVELPNQCPTCGAAVEEMMEVTLDWNYGDGTPVGVPYPDNGVPLPPVGYCCLGCGHLFAWGHQAVIDRPSREVEQATVWSHSLDELISRS